MAKPERPPLPGQGEAAGEEQLALTALAALVARSGRDSLAVTVEDLRLLYELYPRGYGLVVYHNQGTGAMLVSLVGEQSLDLVKDIVDDVRGGRPMQDAIPELFKPTS